MDFEPSRRPRLKATPPAETRGVVFYLSPKRGHRRCLAALPGSGRTYAAE